MTQKTKIIVAVIIGILLVGTVAVFSAKDSKQLQGSLRSKQSQALTCRLLEDHCEREIARGIEGLSCRRYVDLCTEDDLEIEDDVEVLEDDDMEAKLFRFDEEEEIDEGEYNEDDELSAEYQAEN